MSLKKRNTAADIIRCIAFFFVVSVHFLLNNEFYKQPVVGKRMFVMCIMRALFIICVPLFITLSGYLLNKKAPSKKYYSRIGKIYLTYILASIACIAYSVIFMEEELALKGAVLKILAFKGAPYAWYIEMYLGLFLLIPFLNILYNNIPTKKWKQVLILSLVALTALPGVVNQYNFTSLDWWSMPSGTDELNKLIPAWWQSIYPLTYYFIGCYLKEYGLKIKRSVNVLLIPVCVIISGLYTFWRSYNVKFIWGKWCDYGSFFNVILTVLVFGFIINLNYEKMPKVISGALQKISALCLGGYLVSWIFDTHFYPELIEKIPDMPDRLEYYVVIVPLVFLSSLVASFIISKIQLLIEKIFSFIFKKLRKRNVEEKEKMMV